MAGLLSPPAGGFFAAPRINNLITSADVLRSRKPGSYLRGSISSHSPSVLERAEQKITGLLSYVMPRKEAAKLARKATSFANDFTPAGDAITAAQAGADFRQGNILSGLGNTAIAAIGVVPGVGDVAAKGLKKGIRAYHGSPHDFDKFSLSKMGTGEGAQSYGHGLYFAEKPDVAREYQRQLAGKLDNPLDRRGVPQHLVNAAKMMHTGGMGRDDVSAALVSAYKTATPEQIALAVQMGHPGHLYEVNINADPNSLLDWDKPLGEQAPQVLEGLAGIAKRNDIYDSFDPKRIVYEPELSGSSVYQRIRLGEQHPGAVAPVFREAGIPGIKYLDQGSRQTGAGSRNFVIFDDSIIDILNKY